MTKPKAPSDIRLWHCTGARSMRCVWMLEEMGLPYQLTVLPFPPRMFQKDYLAINPLGTIPYLVDGDVKMTESSAICHYLGETYGPTNLVLKPGEKDYARYLNFMFMSDATLTFPQTLVLRYTQLEPPERRVPQVADDYAKWFYGRLRAIEAALVEGEYLSAGRFTAADITVGYALHLATSLRLDAKFPPAVAAYYARLAARPAFQRAAGK